MYISATPSAIALQVTENEIYTRRMFRSFGFQLRLQLQRLTPDVLPIAGWKRCFKARTAARRKAKPGIQNSSDENTPMFNLTPDGRRSPERTANNYAHPSINSVLFSVDLTTST